jgi:hypothetical protein
MSSSSADNKEARVAGAVGECMPNYSNSTAQGMMTDGAKKFTCSIAACASAKRTVLIFDPGQVVIHSACIVEPPVEWYFCTLAIGDGPVATTLTVACGRRSKALLVPSQLEFG